MQHILLVFRTILGEFGGADQSGDLEGILADGAVAQVVVVLASGQVPLLLQLQPRGGQVQVQRQVLQLLGLHLRGQGFGRTKLVVRIQATALKLQCKKLQCPANQIHSQLLPLRLQLPANQIHCQLLPLNVQHLTNHIECQQIDAFEKPFEKPLYYSSNRTQIILIANKLFNS